MSLTDKNLILDIGKAIGISEAEMRWMFERTKSLRAAGVVDKKQIVAAVKEEAKGKPWLKSSTT